MHRLALTIKPYCVYNPLVRYFRTKRAIPTSHIPNLKPAVVIENENILNIEYKSKDEMSSMLQKLGFQKESESKSSQYTDEVLIQYLKHIKSNYKRSSKNLRKLQTLLKKNDASQTDTNFNLLLNYLLEESNIEIEQYKKSNSRKHEIENSNITSNRIDEDDDQSLILNELFSQNDLSNQNDTIFSNFSFLLHILIDLNVKSKTIPISDMPISIEQCVQLFELSKLHPNAASRAKGIFLAGNLIYATGKVRMDPVNESIYIDSLLNYNEFKKAKSLFDSNKLKVNQKWWNEMGMVIALHSNSIKNFDTLLIETDNSFMDYPYLSSKVLLLAIKKKLYMHDSKSVNNLVDRFIDMINKFGFQSIESHNSTKSIFFKDADQAFNFLNDKNLITTAEISRLISLLLYKNDLNSSLKLITAVVILPTFEETNMEYLINHNMFYLLKESESLLKQMELNVSKSSAEALKQLEKFEIILNSSMKEAHEDQEYSELFFDNVGTLLKKPSLTYVINNFVTESKDVTSAEFSKKVQGLLKFFLANDEYLKALSFLNNLEKSKNENTTRNPGQETPTKCVNLNAYHYVEFVQYFILKSVKGSRSKIKRYKSWINDLIERMENNGITPNTCFLSKLLEFYREINDFDNGFQIINQLVHLKLNLSEHLEINSVESHSRKDFNNYFFSEIWKTYFRYFRYFVDNSERINPKDNIYSWNKMVEHMKSKTQIHPMYSHRIIYNLMIEHGTLLNNSNFHVILKTFICCNDWSGVAVVLVHMNDIFGLTVGEKTEKYILKGLERAYINTIAEQQEAASGQSNELIIKEATEEVKALSIKDILLQNIKQFDDGNKILIEEVLKYLKYGKEDLKEQQCVIDAFDEMNVSKESIYPIINHVNSSY